MTVGYADVVTRHGAAVPMGVRKGMRLGVGWQEDEELVSTLVLGAPTGIVPSNCTQEPAA